MKKVLLVAALAVSGLSANAQDMSFGVKAGANFATLSGDDAGDVDMKVGLHIGGVAEFMLSEQFAIQPELLFSMQGYSVEDVNFNLNYINVPISAKYYFTEGFSAHLGPQIGFLMSAKATDGDNDVDIKDGYSSIDYGVNIGAGYKLESGLFFNARYYFGLADIPDTDADVKVKNSVIQVSVGYMF